MSEILPRRFTISAALVLGLSFWFQAIGPGFYHEFSTPTGRWWTIAFGIGAIAILLYGAAARSALALLFLFPAVCLPAIAAVPDPTRLQMMSGFAFIRIGGTLGLYLILVGYALRSDEITPRGAVPTTELPEINRLRTFVLSRVVLSVFLLLVPAYATFADPAIVATIHAKPDGDIQQIFILFVIFFSWLIGTYMFLVVPSLNFAYDQKRMARKRSRFFESYSLRDRVQPLLVQLTLFVIVIAVLGGLSNA